MTTDSPSEPADDSAGREAQVPRIHRFRIGVNVAVQVLLMLILFGLANYLAARHFKQWDYTFDRKFTLADSTVDYLKKVTVPIKITALTIRGSEAEKDLSALLEQYKKTMQGRVELKIIDTRRDVQAFESLKAQLFKYNLVIDRNGVLVQADLPAREGGAQNAYQFISEENLYDVDPVKKTATAFKGESLLNSAIGEVTSVDRPTIGIVAGLGTWRQLPDGTSVYDTLDRIAKLRNFNLEPFPIISESEVPENLDALIWIACGDVGEREEEILRRYFETPGKSMMLMLNPANSTPRLDRFLATYGIVPQDDRIMLAGSTYNRFDFDARFLDGSPLTQGIVTTIMRFLDQSRSLKITTGSEKQRAENIEVKPLLALPGDNLFWGEKNFTEPHPRFDEGTDNGPPLYVAASAERGAAKDPRVQVKSSRLLVFGNSALGDPDSLTRENFDFMARSMNWMLHREVVAPNDSATDKMKHRFQIRIKPSQWQRIFWTTTIILPLAALMTGLMVWSARRS